MSWCKEESRVCGCGFSTIIFSDAHDLESMASQATRLSRLLTPTYASRINAQLVHPAASQTVKPNELQSALARTLHVAKYEPDRPATYLAATLAYGLIQGHPFLDGNKRTGGDKLGVYSWTMLIFSLLAAFFLANEYLRAQGLPGFVERHDEMNVLADNFIAVAKGELDVKGLENCTT